jgi:hypothetical protein
MRRSQRLAAVVTMTVLTMGMAVNAHGDLPQDERRTSFNTVRVGPDTSELRVTTTTGSIDDEIKRAAVKRDGGAVRITLVRTGAPGDLQNTASVPQCLIIRIGQRVGARRVVDGARRLLAEPVRSSSPRRLRRERDRRAWDARGDCRPLPANFYGEQGR